MDDGKDHTLSVCSVYWLKKHSRSLEPPKSSRNLTLRISSSDALVVEASPLDVGPYDRHEAFLKSMIIT